MTKVKINSSRVDGKISKYIYGQFAEHLGRCIYEGLYVGDDSDIPNTNGMRNDVVSALKELEIPVLRWPGGCFADDYHWRDGIGDKSKRPYMVNTNWGGVVENNHFGTHEFFELCEQLNTEPYICGNVGSGTVQEMRDWVEYMTFDGDSPLANERRKNGREEPWKLKFFGVGNENWGCGGNMRAQYYADEYRRYATFIRNYGEEPIYKIAGGPNADDANWTEALMKNIKHATDGISLHCYTFEGDWNNKGKAAVFDKDGWDSVMADTQRMDKTINIHELIMDRYDPENKLDLIVDEWGNWYDVEPGTNPGFLYQQNTIRDAVSGMLILHIFHKHNRRVQMANIAQMVNVLQAMVLTDGEKMILTPTYHLFRMMKGHMDGEKVDIDYTSEMYESKDRKFPKISISASKKNDEMTISLCNTSTEDDEDITFEISDDQYSMAVGEMLTSNNMTDCNTFENPNCVAPSNLDVKLNGNTISVKLPKMSIAVITLKK